MRGKKRQRDKEIKAEGMARAKEKKREEGENERQRTFKSILVIVRLYFSAASCLVHPVYYSFSVCL